MIKDMILANIWGGIMPKFRTHNWNGYNIRLFHNEQSIRSFLSVIPFFWDSEVVFDLGIGLPQGRKEKAIEDTWIYKWELCDLGDTLIKYAGQNTVKVSKLGFRRYLTLYWPWGKNRAVVLGLLPPNKHYQLYMTFTGLYSGKSDRLLFATFTTKDRDEVYMQLFIALIVVIAGIFIGVISKGCSL